VIFKFSSVYIELVGLPEPGLFNFKF